MRDKEKGITLVALVITIIILLILAGVAITALTQTGLFEKAKQAKNATENAQLKEENRLTDYDSKINEIVGSRDTINISKEQYEKLKNANIYSEDEIEIGKWIDGKKLYRKVIKSKINSTVVQNITHNIENIEFSLIEKVVLQDIEGNYHDVSSNSFFKSVAINKNDIIINKASAGDYAEVPIWIILNYTKTTD